MLGNANAARRSADYTARTVQDALERASRDLNVPVDRLDYTVIRDSTHTILGLVRTGEVTIRVRVPAPVEPELGAVEPEAAPPVAPEAAAEPAAAPPAEEEYEAEEELEAEEEFEAEEEPEEYEEDEDEEEEVEVRPAAPAREARGPQDLGRIATDVVSRLIDGMGLYAAVEVVDPGGVTDPQTNEVSPLQINIVGDDLGALIGRRGGTLRDLQFITRLIISRKIGKWPNVVVDVEGYKAHRAEALQALARRMADRVRSTGQPIVLEPMPAYERRIVHLTLRDDEDVYTESTGEGEARKVQILPR